MSGKGNMASLAARAVDGAGMVGRAPTFMTMTTVMVGRAITMALALDGGPMDGAQKSHGMMSQGVEVPGTGCIILMTLE